MKNFAGIAGTKFGSEAVMKSEAAFQNFETPPLRPEVPLQNPELPPVPLDINIPVLNIGKTVVSSGNFL